MVKGTIFNIQRYSLHDGPGIRTVVFFKGCTLACQWCSNPESIQSQPQLFYVKSKCILCGNCVKAAPDHLIKFNQDGSLNFNFHHLNRRDLAWTDCCPTGALDIKGKIVDVDSVHQEVMKDEIYFRQNGGGITLSGGEALKQSEFAESLLRRVYEDNISTAVETAGSVPFESIERVIPWVSLFLFDFKVFDADKHKKFIGVDNELIKQNLASLANRHLNILVRMPVIPEVNDDLDNLEKTLRFLSQIGINRLSLLPFHQYGSNKYDSIGMDYKFADAAPPSEDSIAFLNEFIHKNGFLTQ